MGWVGRARKGSGESETMVSENSPAGGTQETPGGATARPQCALGKWVGRPGFPQEHKALLITQFLFLNQFFLFIYFCVAFLFLKVSSPGCILHWLLCLTRFPPLHGTCLALHLSSSPLFIWSNTQSLTLSPGSPTVELSPLSLLFLMPLTPSCLPHQIRLSGRKMVSFLIVIMVPTLQVVL